MLIQMLCNDFNRLKPYLLGNNCIMLMQNGVYCANVIASKYSKHPHIYALEADWLASGLAKHSDVTLVNYDQWVELTIAHQPIITLQT